jgi:hypothetical protein
MTETTSKRYYIIVKAAKSFHTEGFTAQFLRHRISHFAALF